MSLNDPEWGRRDQRGDSGGNDSKRPSSEGPPDLEDLWRDFNRKLNGMLNKKGSGDQGGGNSPKMPQMDFNPRLLSGGAWLILVVLLLVWLASGLYIVDESQRGVVLQFG